MVQILKNVLCANCGCEFAIPLNLYEVAQHDENFTFFCPYGHGLHYNKPQKKKEPKKELPNNVISIDEWKRKRNDLR